MRQFRRARIIPSIGMMEDDMNARLIMTVCGVALALGGCDGVASHGPLFDTNVLLPVLHTRVPGKSLDLSATTDGNSENDVIIPPNCRLSDDPRVPGATPDTSFPTGLTKANRNECMWSLIRIIDQKYDLYSNRLHAVATGTGAFFDVAIAGLSAAATATTGAAAKTVLSAINSGLSGTKGALDADILYNKSIDIVRNQMDADRATQLTAIIKQMSADTTTYGMSQAKDDLLKYYEMGTFGHALQALENQTAATATTCKAQAQATKVKAVANSYAHDDNGASDGTGPSCTTSQSPNTNQPATKEPAKAAAKPSPA
jgi:hypothetical protein